MVAALLGLGLLCTGLLSGCGGGSSTDQPAAEGAVTLTVAQAGEQDASGNAVHLGQAVTTEGVVTVSAGVLANNKLKVFIQGSPEGIMVFHEDSSKVNAADFQAGNRVEVTGVIRQADPAGGGNAATGTVLIDISDGSWRVVSAGNALPSPTPVTLAQLVANGNAYEGTLVNVLNVQKVAGNWPAAGAQSTSVTVNDGTAALTLRFQKNTIDAAMAAELAAIGNGPFHLEAIVVQSDTSGDATLLDGFELWVREADDITDSIDLVSQAALGTTVTTEGIVTVASGVLFDNKFEVFIQDGSGGLMCLNSTPPAGLSVAAGDLVRVTGTLAQTDTSGQPLTGTLRVDFTASGGIEILSSGNALPAPQVLTLAQYLASPQTYQGQLIRIDNASKTAGSWPAVGVKGNVTINDGTGGNIKLQAQKNANTADLTGTANPFDVVGLAVQNGASAEVWIRGPADIISLGD
jgi:hypothetical protein